jgi:hypothetical protein
MKRIRFSALCLVILLTIMSGACTSLSLGSSKYTSKSNQPFSTALLDANTLRLGQVLVTGRLDSISSNSVVVNHLPIRIDNLTIMPQGLKPGDQTKVLAIQLPDKTHYAVEIAFADTGGARQNAASQNISNNGEFQFLGIVTQTGKNDWNISGLSVELNEETTVDERLKSGHIAHVEGAIVNGVFVASKIEYDESERDHTDSENPAAGITGTPELGQDITLTPTVQNNIKELDQEDISTTPTPSGSSEDHPETKQTNSSKSAEGDKSDSHTDD